MIYQSTLDQTVTISGIGLRAIHRLSTRPSTVAVLSSTRSLNAVSSAATRHGSPSPGWTGAPAGAITGWIFAG